MPRPSQRTTVTEHRLSLQWTLDTTFVFVVHDVALGAFAFGVQRGTRRHLMSTPRVRIAFVGKGGAGKSTAAGTFARLLARRGEPVLALDSDPLPGMPYALGIPIDDSPIPDDVVVGGPHGGPRWLLRADLDAEKFIDLYGVVCPDGVRYLQFGNLWGHVSTMQRAQQAWSQVVREVDPERWNLVGDLPGGTRQAMAGWGKYAEIVCVVVEPTVKSIHSAARLLNLSHASWGPRSLMLVANKVRDADDVARIEQRLGVAVAATLPRDDAILDADRRGRAPLDDAANGPYVAAVQSLLDHVLDSHPSLVGGSS